MPSTDTPALIAIVGPTGSGKSRLALDLAEYFDGEIINYDSVQLYRHLDIGSAKLPESERRGIPHHLLDVFELDQAVNAGEFVRLARPLIQQIHQRQKLPILVGGTGLYLRALLEGLSPAPSRDPALRRRLSEIANRRPISLHRYLFRYDPAAAARIHPNDIQKLIRAIELTRQSRRPASEVQRQPRLALTGVHTLKLGLDPPRSELYARLDTRSKSMFDNGLLEETRAAIQCFSAAGQPPPLTSLGYRQAAQVLSGELSLGDAMEETQRRTRQYAKRQWTWFRADPAVHWLPGFGSAPDVLQGAIALIKAHLNKND